jgi:DNA (cytosine-5)-methyltransferase 1
MKILNLYAGIGGNRKLWTEHHKDLEITAVENNKEIAKIYKDFFPDDEMIVTDAHEYLLHNYRDYDFIWSSPPCPSHSKLRHFHEKKIYPDMSLYQEIIFLKHYAKGKWIIENVDPYYEPLIPTVKRGRHLIWCNFLIPEFPIIEGNIIHEWSYGDFERKYGFCLLDYKLEGLDRRHILRNCVDPELGLHILNQALQRIDKTKSTQLSLLD